MKPVFLTYLFILILSSSCAGYHLNTNNNPLISYDIKSVSVPMFINRTVIPDLAAPITREIILTLNSYSGLDVNNSNEKSDAILIGVLESKDYYKEVVQTSQKLFTSDTVGNSIGNRTGFYYPVQTTYSFWLNVYLIKNMTSEELDMISKGVIESLEHHPKIVLFDRIDLSNNFYRVVGETSAATSAGKTNFVKNHGIMIKSIEDTAINAANAFKQVVLNAF